ncbi:RNA polymerase sigma factor [candidate division KSB1 bacterium]|nr:RNA polymerase sigma factor [candidate division KSB1 bacterium]
MASDEQLMLRYCRGNRQAMADLIERYRDEMLNFFYRRVDSQALAEDLVQELFLKVIRHAAGFKARSKFSTWLYRIAINQLKNYYRRPKLEALSEKTDAIEKSAVTPDDHSTTIHLKADLNRFISKLKKEFQIILELTYFQDLDTEEVARVLELPVGTVKSRRFYALRQLGKLMQESE